MKNVELSIKKMECEGCVNRIKRVLDSYNNISDYQISLKNSNIILFNIDHKILQEVIKKIEDLGFEVIKK